MRFELMCKKRFKKFFNQAVSITDQGLSILKVLISMTCYSCVAWQFIICFARYLSYPVSTSIAIGKSTENLGLVLTFCYKGFTNHGVGFKNFYEEGMENGKFLGRLDKSFIRTLDFQFKDSDIWINAWNDKSTEDEDLFTTFLEPYPDLLYCNSWTIPKGTGKIRVAEANTDNLYMFVHGCDMFSLASMRGSLQRKSLNGIYIFNTDIEITKTLSKETNPCEMNPAQYPDFMRGKYLATKMSESNGCVTPFIQGQKTTCTTNENATSIVRKMKKIPDNFEYILPCNIVKIKMILQSKQFNEYEEENIEGNNQSFIIRFPALAIFTDASFTYSFGSFLAEFGSWLGLFTGMSVVQVNFKHIIYYSHIQNIISA